PLFLENGEQHGVADVAGPSDAVGADQAFADSAELLHRCLAAGVAAVDSELDPADATVESTAQHHVLDPPVEAGASEFGPIVGAADLQHLSVRVDAEIGGHAGKLVAVEQDEGPVAAVGYVAVDAGVEAIRPEVVGVDLPYFAILGAGRP